MYLNSVFNEQIVMIPVKQKNICFKAPSTHELNDMAF